MVAPHDRHYLGIASRRFEKSGAYLGVIRKIVEVAAKRSGGRAAPFRQVEAEALSHYQPDSMAQPRLAFAYVV